MQDGLTFGYDLNGSRYVEWNRGSGGWARAWVSQRSEDKDWAGAKRTSMPHVLISLAEAREAMASIIRSGTTFPTTTSCAPSS